jgi:HEAT repeat protein
MKTNLLLGLILFVLLPAAVNADEAEEERLMAVIQSGAPASEKEGDCWRLKQIGTAKSVPALANLLGDEHLYQAACDALVTLPGTEASEALRAALKTSSGKPRAGVIHALGERRYAAAVPDLADLLQDSDVLIATSSARALGEIGGNVAVQTLREAMKVPPVQLAAVDALVRCASHLAANGDRAAAVTLFQELDNPQNPEQVRAAAYAGVIRSPGDRALEFIVSGVEGADLAKQAAALQVAREIENPRATVAFTNLLTKSGPEMQAALLALLEQRADSSAAPAVVALTGSADPYVRVSAIAALGVLGDASAVPLLAAVAASRDEAEQKAGRQALIALRRGDVGGMMVSQLPLASPEVQAELARALAARWEKSAVRPLLELARSNFEATRQAAIRTLSLLADGSHLAALVKLMSEATTEVAREDIRGVFESIVDHAEGRKGFDVAPLIASLDSGSRETRIALLQVSALFADERVRTAFRSALKDSDPQIRDAAARAICDTRDPDLLPDLLALARNASEVNLRALALEGYVRLVREDASGFNAARRAELLKPAVELASRPEEKRLVLSALGSAPHRDSLLLAERSLTDEAVKTEAEAACLQIAKALGSSHPEAVETSLRRLVASGSATARTNAQAILKQLDSGWLCAGPYRQEGKSAQDLFDVAFPPEQAGRSEVKWRHASGSPDLARRGEVVLDGIVGGDHCVVYLKTQVFVPVAQLVNLELGSDDGIKFWVNGELVHANNAVRGLTPGQDRAKASLREGWNELMAKITQHTLGCGMTLRIVTADGKEVSGLRFDPRGGSK